jgi:hypothetical protein
MFSTRYRQVSASTGRTSSTWLLKKVLASLMVVGALTSVTVSGTFALLTSQESNARSAVASGTLTFSDTVNLGTCFSYIGGSSVNNVNSNCQAAITSSTLNYPGTPAVVPVTIANNGSLDAAGLSVYMPSCTMAATPGAPSPGGANPCAVNGAQFYIQETTQTGTPTTCWFPLPSAPGACAFTANSLQQFSANVNTTSSALSLGGGPAHNATRYFKIGLQLPTTASNSFQGEAAVFVLAWHLST